MLEPLNGEQLQFLVGLHLRRDGLTRTLPHLNFQRAGVSCPTTRGIRLEEIRDRRQRLGLPVQLVERIRAPVECRVGARSFGRDQRGEALDRLWPLRALDRLLTLLVEIVKTVARLLGALAFAFGALPPRQNTKNRRPSPAATKDGLASARITDAAANQALGIPPSITMLLLSSLPR